MQLERKTLNILKTVFVISYFSQLMLKTLTLKLLLNILIILSTWSRFGLQTSL